MTGQLTLPVRTERLESAEGLLAAALTWIADNPVAWQYIVRSAEHDARECGRVHVKRDIEYLRGADIPFATERVKIPNAFSAAATRLLRHWHPDIAHAVPSNRSKLDGCTLPPRPY